VIFEEVQSATEALQAANGFTFFGKDLKIEYANEKSDRISKRDGTYVPKSKRRKIVKESLAAAASGGGNEASSGDDKKEPEAKQTGEEEPATKATETGVPSKILFAQELPEECNSMMLEMLFRQVRAYTIQRQNIVSLFAKCCITYLPFH
jgi:U2 small nuclear ribonucleoprotein B''